MAASPFVHLKPRLFMDQGKWCALYGENLQDGLAGFGDTPEGAMSDFDHNFRCQKSNALVKKDGNAERFDSMMEAAKPLIKWINENCHPHSHVIVDHTEVELWEGVGVRKTQEFLKD